jgi:hypothetical protein
MALVKKRIYAGKKWRGIKLYGDKIRRMKKIGTALIIIAIISFYFISRNKTYPIFKYFPLNENDTYTYDHREDVESDTVKIIVEGVKQTSEGKRFTFLWKGKYNDRKQLNILTSRGIIFYQNEHLVGQAPLRVIRMMTPPLLMIPSELRKSIFTSTIQNIYDVNGKYIDKEKIEAEINFVGFEEVKTGAGNFKCIHFFIRHNYKDPSGKSIHMHTYNFWIARDIGIVKLIHTFTPFLYNNFFRPEDKTIMNRYGEPFTAYFELKKAVIGGKVIGQQ